MAKKKRNTKTKRTNAQPARNITASKTAPLGESQRDEDLTQKAHAYVDADMPHENTGHKSDKSNRFSHQGTIGDKENKRKLSMTIKKVENDPKDFGSESEYSDHGTEKEAEAQLSKPQEQSKNMDTSLSKQQTKGDLHTARDYAEAVRTPLPEDTSIHPALRPSSFIASATPKEPAHSPVPNLHRWKPLPPAPPQSITPEAVPLPPSPPLRASSRPVSALVTSPPTAAEGQAILLPQHNFIQHPADLSTESTTSTEISANDTTAGRKGSTDDEKQPTDSYANKTNTTSSHDNEKAAVDDEDEEESLAALRARLLKTINFRETSVPGTPGSVTGPGAERFRLDYDAERAARMENVDLNGGGKREGGEDGGASALGRLGKWFGGCMHLSGE